MQVEDLFADLPVLQTERLILRKITLQDAQDIYAYASDPEVAKDTAWEPHQSLEESRGFIHSIVARYDRHTVAPWGVVYHAEAKLIGTCGFCEWQPRHARAEIAYALSRHYWGYGLMQEAVRTVIDFGFQMMVLNRIEARCLPENARSARVMEKCGMRFEGLLREHQLVKGACRDIKMYSILRREWQA